MLDGASVVACLCQRKFKTAATVMFMLRISGLLEEYTQARTKAVLTDSLAIKTDRVWLVTDDGDVLIPIEDLRVDDKIRVQTGKVIPVDGVVADGEATVNESSMTGEPLPVLKREGISVYAGTVIEEGSIVVTVRQLASNTKISKIIELIGNLRNSRQVFRAVPKLLPTELCRSALSDFSQLLSSPKTSQGQFHFLWLTTPVQSSCQPLLP